MWDLATIRAMNADRGILARAKRVKPTLLKSEKQLDKMPPFPFPHIGDMSNDLDEKHDRVDSLFCDSYGFGDSRSLSETGLKRRLRELLKEHGPLMVAIEEQGQFQLYVGVWKEKKDDSVSV